jgi:hypothetical protein
MSIKHVTSWVIYTLFCAFSAERLSYDSLGFWIAFGLMIVLGGGLALWLKSRHKM